MRDQRGSGLCRHTLLQAAAASMVSGGVIGPAAADDAPWVQRPPGKVDKVNFVVWTYGDIYTKIARQFQDDWGVPVDATISSLAAHPAKLMAMYGSGDPIDVTQSSAFTFARFINQGPCRAA